MAGNGTTYYGDLLERLEDKFLVGDGCWPWTAALGTDGYGFFKYQGKGHRAHRVLYELFKGPIPDGLELDHICRNRSCVRPDHLEPVTHRDNMRRGMPFREPITHCKHGHELIGDNVRVRYGKRECRVCFRLRDREYQTARRNRLRGRQ